MRLHSFPRFGNSYTFAQVDSGVVKPGSVIKVPGEPASPFVFNSNPIPDRYYSVNWDWDKMLLAPLQTPEQAGLDSNTQFQVVA